MQIKQLLAICVLLATPAAAQTPPEPPLPAATVSPTNAPLSIPPSLPERQGSPLPQGPFWSQNRLRASATARASAQNNAAMRRQITLRSALALANRELALQAGLVRVIENTTLEGYASLKKLHISALIQGARLVGDPVFHENGDVTVTLEVPLFGVQGLTGRVPLQAALRTPQRPLVEKASLDPEALTASGYQAPENYTALILDARQLNFKGSLIPVFCSPEACLDVSFTPEQLRRGILTYRRDLEQSLLSARQAGLNPLVLKVQAESPEGHLLLSTFDLEMFAQVQRFYSLLGTEWVTLVSGS